VKETLEAINQMQADGVIGKYAIGGAVGATFYIEPAATVDLDVFVMLPGAASKTLISLSPIYEYLKAKGGREEAEYLVLGDWPVQFLVPSDTLESEAVTEAVPTEVEGVRTWVMSAEHLAAIALRTSRPKDHIRIIQFVSQGALDRDKMNTLLLRHGLTEKWKQFESRFLEGTHG
jgi:hypothetical protein